MARLWGFWTSIIFGLLMLALSGCQGPRLIVPTASLTLDNPTWVHFPLQSEAQIYTFSANPGAATLLSFYSLSPGLAYTAELRDGRGALLATLTGSLPNAELTVNPGSDVYQVTVKPGREGSAGALSLIASSGRAASAASAVANNFNPDTSPLGAQTSEQTIALVSPAISACSASSSAGANVNIRSAPGLENPIIGRLVLGSSIDVDGRSANGWFRVNNSGAEGWVSGSVVSVTGQCDSLPQVSAEAEPFQLVVKRNGSANQTDRVSPGDVSDLIQVVVADFLPQPPDNYGEFTLTLFCDGQGKEWVRWGSPESQSFVCDTTIVLPFMSGSDHQWFAVTLPSAANTLVNYTLTVARRT